MIGATSPLASEPGTIRGDLAIITGKNIMYVIQRNYSFNADASCFCSCQNILLTSYTSFYSLLHQNSHGSDSKESAEFEIGLWFTPQELNNWKKTDVEAWVYE